MCEFTNIVRIKLACNVGLREHIIRKHKKTGRTFGRKGLSIITAKKTSRKKSINLFYKMYLPKVKLLLEQPMNGHVMEYFRVVLLSQLWERTGFKCI